MASTLVIEIAGILIGLFYVVMGAAKYGVWKGISISGGFMPIVCGGLLVIFCVLMILSKVKKKEHAEKLSPKVLIPLGAMAAILVLNYLVGLIGACIIVAFLWVKFIEKFSWKKSILTAVVLFMFVYGIFRLWLTVPFPTGLLGTII